MRKTLMLAAMAALLSPGLRAADAATPAAIPQPTLAPTPLGTGLGGVNSPYVDDVLRRRAQYGNSDGLPRTNLLQSRQLLFTLGQVVYVGDAYLVKDGLGSTVLNSSDLGSLSYGLAFAQSFNDFIAWELWGDYSTVTKSYSYATGPATTFNASSNLTRFDIGVGPKIQRAIALDGPERNFQMIPNLGLTPFYAGNSGSSYDSNGNSISLNHGNVGASLNVGLDFQFAGALLAVKARYLLSNDVTGGLHSSNTSAWLPQIGAGFAF